MSVPFDLVPTQKLSGFHMVGTVARRFLISYPVSPEALNHYLPPGAEWSTHDGAAWVSACFVRMDGMRPNVLPGFAGMSFHYLIYRTRARLPFPDGQLREAVIILEPNINRKLLSSFGSMFVGVGFRNRHIECTEDEDHWRISMKWQGELLYDATIEKSSYSGTIPRNSRFASAQEADSFLLGVSYGGAWQKGQATLSLLPETHDPWQTVVCKCTTHKNRFLESLGIDGVEADHAITMSGIPHYFGMTPVRTNFRNVPA